MVISTIYIGSARGGMEQVKPPRSVFLDFPFGRQCGRPFDRGLQLSIIKDSLQALASITEPGTIIDLPYNWGEDFDCVSGQQWTTKSWLESDWRPETSSGNMTR